MKYNFAMPNHRLQASMDGQNQKHYSAVGKVAVEWTRFEGYVNEMIRMLANVDNRFGECMTAQIANVNRSLDALCALVDLRKPGAADDKNFKKLIERIQSVAERRNRVVHDNWTFDPGVTMRWPTSIRRRYRSEPIDMPTSQVEALADDIATLANDFLTFRRKFLKSVKLWPGQ
ncbi:MAG: hypothetical protein ACHQ1H_00650 [Nitrososphaerales archaeon]